MLDRRLARGMERVVRDVVDGAHDPAVVAEVEHVDTRGACSKVPKKVRSPGEGVRDADPVDATVEDREGRVPVARDQAIEGVNAIGRFAERLAAEEARRFVRDPERADEGPLELLGRQRVEPAAAPLRELGPRSTSGRARRSRPSPPSAAGRSRRRGRARLREHLARRPRLLAPSASAAPSPGHGPPVSST